MDIISFYILKDNTMQVKDLITKLCGYSQDAEIYFICKECKKRSKLNIRDDFFEVENELTIGD